MYDIESANLGSSQLQVANLYDDDQQEIVIVCHQGQDNAEGD